MKYCYDILVQEPCPLFNFHNERRLQFVNTRNDLSIASLLRILKQEGRIDEEGSIVRVFGVSAMEGR